MGRKGVCRKQQSWLIIIGTVRRRQHALVEVTWGVTVQFPTEPIDVFTIDLGHSRQTTKGWIERTLECRTWSDELEEIEFILLEELVQGIHRPRRSRDHDTKITPRRLDRTTPHDIMTILERFKVLKDGTALRKFPSLVGRIHRFPPDSQDLLDVLVVSGPAGKLVDSLNQSPPGEFFCHTAGLDKSAYSPSRTEVCQDGRDYWWGQVQQRHWVIRFHERVVNREYDNRGTVPPSRQQASVVFLLATFRPPRQRPKAHQERDREIPFHWNSVIFNIVLFWCILCSSVCRLVRFVRQGLVFRCSFVFSLVCDDRRDGTKRTSPNEECPSTDRADDGDDTQQTADALHKTTDKLEALGIEAYYLYHVRVLCFGRSLHTS